MGMAIYIVGSFNNWTPEVMPWEGGLFKRTVVVGSEGTETFQLMLDGLWAKRLYPSVPDANPYEEFAIKGPDNKGHDMNWQIGKPGLERVEPGLRFAIFVALDEDGVAYIVHWQTTDEPEA